MSYKEQRSKLPQCMGFKLLYSSSKKGLLLKIEHGWPSLFDFLAYGVGEGGQEGV